MPFPRQLGIPELVKHEKIMGCAFDASYYAIHQIQVSVSLQLFAFRRIYPSRHVAEKGSYAEPVCYGIAMIVSFLSFSG